MVNRGGFPLAHEIFEGNRQDQKTLDEMLNLLDDRLGLQPGQTVVVDRGMAYDENLKEIRSRNLKYIVAARQPERDQWLADFEDEEDFQEVIRPTSPWNHFQKKSPIQVKIRKEKDVTYVLCLSEGRKEKDRAIRENQEKKLLNDIKKLEKAKRLDGSYILKTDRDDLNAEEAWRIYNLLARAEKAFRDMKSPLSERPIFHHLERRVDTHIFLCVLAYHLLAGI